MRFTVERGKWNGPEGLEPKVSGTSLALPTVAGDERFRHLFELPYVQIYSIYPDTLRQPQKYSPDRPMGMATIGSRFYEIRNSSTWKPEIVLDLLTGNIKDVKVSEVAGYLVAQFRHVSNAGQVV